MAGTADILFFYDPEGDMARWDVLYAKRVLKIKDETKMKTAKSWEDLARKIKRYRKIDRLVLSFHGAPGALIVGSHYKELDSTFVKDLFTKPERAKKVPRGAGNPSKLVPFRLTKIDRIDIESCNVAKRPDMMVAFAKLFHAKRISGWTYFRVLTFVTLDLSQGVTEAQVRELITRRKYKEYLLPDNPTPAQIAEKAKKERYKVRLLAMWFRDSYDDSPLPDNPNERTYRPPGDYGVEREIRGEADAKTAVSDYSDELLLPFHHVTVWL
jgi:hypothetical protein